MSSPAFEINGKVVQREEFYTVACDPRRSVAVEACAGSGKTWMLVSRILRALLEDCAAHEILAITFTKKAAGEMRQRLNEWLAEFSNAAPEKLEGELLARGLSPEAARSLREPLKNLYQTLLNADRPVQIRTFHSWFASLLRAAPMSVLDDLGLPANYELLEDDAQAVEKVWRPFYEALLKDSDARQDYEAVVAKHGRFHTEKALTAALQRRVEFELADTKGKVLDSVPPYSVVFPDLAQANEPLDLLLRPGALHQTLWVAAKTLGQATQPSFSAKGGELQTALTQGDAAAVIVALMTKDGSARKFSDKLNGIELVREAQAQLERISQAQQQHEAWTHQQRMTRLTRVLIAEFAVLKRQQGWIDMNDLERAGLYLLADPVLGAWVQERLDARVRHLLIDEFQDTNPLQWQALSAWLSSYAGVGGGALAPRVFIVGDPKQSIYRFRRAEPQVFLAAQKFVVQQLVGDLLSCDHTRRNAAPVIGLVNDVMMAAQSEGHFQEFRPHTTESVEAGAVLKLPQILRPAKTDINAETESAWRDSLTMPREIPEETLLAQECRQAANWIAQQISSGVAPNHIMVLARKRSRLTAMQEALQALHIPAQQPEKTDLAEMPEVQDIVALLDALVSQQHDLSLARALKSPLFGASDEVLIQLVLCQPAQGQRMSWFELLQSEPPDIPGLNDVGARLKQWKHWLDTLPPHDALDAIYQDGDVLARFGAATPAALRQSVLANLQALLSAALQIDGARYATPYAFVRALKADGIKAPARAVSDAVQLLTVHGAKGLEASLVLLLDTDAQERKAQTMGVLVDWPGESLLPHSFVFLASETRLPVSVVDAMHKEQQARDREEINALYVALTRAKHQLVLSAIEPHHADASSWWQRIQSACQELKLPESEPVIHKTAQTVFSLHVLPACTALQPLATQSERTDLLSEVQLRKETSLSSRLGQAMHRLLEWAPLGAVDCPAHQVRQVAQEFGLDAAQGNQAAAMAQRILCGEGRWAWDAAQIAWHSNELAIIVQGQVRRIDRLVRLATGQWWVLDYKSAAHAIDQLELLAQLQSYRSAVQAAYPGEPVKAAFLSAQGTLEILEDVS